MTSSNISMLMDQVLLEISRLSGNIEDICGETSMVYDNEIQGVQEFAEDLSCKVHVLEKGLQGLKNTSRNFKIKDKAITDSLYHVTICK